MKQLWSLTKRLPSPTPAETQKIEKYVHMSADELSSSAYELKPVPYDAYEKGRTIRENKKLEHRKRLLPTRYYTIRRLRKPLKHSPIKHSP